MTIELGTLGVMILGMCGLGITIFTIAFYLKHYY